MREARARTRERSERFAEGEARDPVESEAPRDRSDDVERIAAVGDRLLRHGLAELVVVLVERGDVLD